MPDHEHQFEMKILRSEKLWEERVKVPNSVVEPVCYSEMHTIGRRCNQCGHTEEQVGDNLWKVIPSGA